MRWIRWAAAGLGLFVGAGAIAFGLTAVTGIADAQTPVPGDGPFARYAEKLAEKLGIDVETLRTARQEAREELLDEAVAAGRLTQEQADRLQNGRPGRGLRGAFGPPFKHNAYLAVRGAIEATAEVLGIGPDEVVSGVRNGQSLAQLAEAQGIEREAFEASLLEALQDEIDEAESNGRLTAEQADRLSEALDERIDQIIDETGNLKLPGRPMRLLMPDQN